jgi:hypothetical protein
MPLHLSRIRALCFDVDGTLSDTDDLLQARFARLSPRCVSCCPAGTCARPPAAW